MLWGEATSVFKTKAKSMEGASTRLMPIFRQPSADGQSVGRNRNNQGEVPKPLTPIRDQHIYYRFN